MKQVGNYQLVPWFTNDAPFLEIYPLVYHFQAKQQNIFINVTLAFCLQLWVDVLFLKIQTPRGSVQY